MNATPLCESSLSELSLPSSRAESPAPEAPDANLHQGRWTQEQFDAIKARNVGDMNASVFAQMNVQILAAEEKAHGTRAQLMVGAAMVEKMRASIHLHHQHMELLQVQFAQQMAQHQAHIAQHEAAVSDMQAHMANLSMMAREQTSAATMTKSQASAIMSAVAASATPVTADYLDPADAPLMPAPDAAPCLIPIENGEAADVHEKPVAEALAVLAPRARSPASDTADEDAAGQADDDEGARPRRRATRSRRGGWRVKLAQARALESASIGEEIERVWNTAHMQRALIAWSEC